MPYLGPGYRYRYGVFRKVVGFCLVRVLGGVWCEGFFTWCVSQNLGDVTAAAGGRTGVVKLMQVGVVVKLLFFFRLGLFGCGVLLGRRLCCSGGLLLSRSGCCGSG